jgi:ABC-2 type transport system permease protein
MTTATVSPAPVRARRALLRSEARLFLREPAAVFWVVGFPTVLLAVLGCIPSFRDPDDALGGLRMIDVYVPVAVLVSLLMSGLQAMPTVLSGYRERGILRRMSTTPVRPGALLGAQMGLHGVAALASALLTLAVGRIAFGVPLPARPAGYLLALALSVVAALALGSLVAALARTSKAASAVGSVLLFPMMFSAGVWLPVQAMPDVLSRLVEFTPFGAAAQALGATTAGDGPGWRPLLVLAGWAAVLCWQAARRFRWQ